MTDANLDAIVDDASIGLGANANGTQPISAQARRRRALPLALVVSGVAAAALAGLVGWSGYRAHQASEVEQQRELFMRVGRQGALDLTSISHTEVDADVRRILDTSTGSFQDDFQQRWQPFIDLVKREQSTSHGTITEAGLQSMTSDSARVLVAVSVKTTTAAVPDPHVNSFRLRIDVNRVNGGAKVSNVEFVS
jgi:Mce-associated membrane protein